MNVRIIQPRVAVVVPVYNRIHTTLVFLRELRAIPYANRETVIIDDGSTDRTSEIIARDFPEVRLLHTPGEYWWSKSMNLGVRDALSRKADFILTLNDDVSFEPDFLDRLVQFAREHPRTLVGSSIYSNDDRARVWYMGGKISPLLGEFLHRASENDGTLRWLTGMGTLIPVEVFSTIGLYDELGLPQYMADADLSMRASRAGFGLRIEPRSLIYNRIQESGADILRRNVSLRNFLTPLFTRRSVAHWSTRRTMYRRYWPPLLGSLVMAIYYARFFAKRSLRLLKIR